MSKEKVTLDFNLGNTVCYVDDYYRIELCKEELNKIIEILECQNYLGSNEICQI